MIKSHELIRNLGFQLVVNGTFFSRSATAYATITDGTDPNFTNGGPSNPFEAEIDTFRQGTITITKNK